MPWTAQERDWRDLLMGLESPEERRRRVQFLLKRETESMTQYVKEDYEGMSLNQIAAKEGVTILDSGQKSWRYPAAYSGKYREGYYGQQNVILLKKDLTPRDRRETLARELAHY